MPTQPPEETLPNEKVCLIRGDGGRMVRVVLDRMADRWSLLVVATLDGGSLRYSELQRRVSGVSQRMLTRTLRGLQRDGLVSRTSFPEVPPRVEYELTETGRSLVGPAVTLAQWAAEHGEQVALHRAEYDREG